MWHPDKSGGSGEYQVMFCSFTNVNIIKVLEISL